MKAKPKTRILPAARPPMLRSVLPPAVSDGRNRTDPATAAARRPRTPAHPATAGNHALHHTPRNAQS